MGLIASMILKHLSLLIGLASSLFFSIMAFGIHLLPDSLNSFFILFIRSGFISLVLLPWGLTKSPAPWSRRSFSLWLRAIGGVGAMLCFYWNLTQISVTHSFLFGNFSPLIVVVLSPWLLNERIKPVQLLGVILAVLAVVSPPILGLSKENYHWHHLVIGISGAFSLGVASLSLRSASQDHHPAVVVFWMTTLGAVVSAAWMTFQGLWENQWGAFRNHLPLFLGIVIMSLLAQLARTFHFKTTLAPIATTVSLSTIAFGTLLEVTFLDFDLTPTDGFSILFVMLGIILTQSPALYRFMKLPRG